MKKTNLPQLTLLYHYFHPDDVISARLFTDLAIEMSRQGWRVFALPCNRGCRDETIQRPVRDQVDGVKISRVWRPAIRQSSTIGRIVNAVWMICAWSLRAITTPRNMHEAVIIGTDPIFGIMAAIPWRLLRPRCKVIHWCHDVYPDALIADGIIRERALLTRLVRFVLSAAYHRCDAVADLGDCMRRVLTKHAPKLNYDTMPPWSLIEPAVPAETDAKTRESLFGKATLGLLYSGNFGRAHDYSRFIELARLLRNEPIHFCFAARGNRTTELQAAVRKEDVNISVADFADESELEKRLGACDLHLVSLREEWTGAVVPSKFFGALAAGRGVLFAGSPESAIAGWIQRYDLGVVLDGSNATEVATQLRALASNRSLLESLRIRCHETYQREFSKRVQLDAWVAKLDGLVMGRDNTKTSNFASPAESGEARGVANSSELNFSRLSSNAI